MRRYSSGLALAVLLIWAGSAIPSHSQAQVIFASRSRRRQ